MRLTADYPKIWLAAFALAAWAAGRLFPHGGSWPGLGWAVVMTGLTLMLWAGWTMRRAQTTVDPFGQPLRLVTWGPFRWSRNPIYLADAIMLAGLCVIFRAPLAALPLVAGFVAVIQARFIRAEEERLAQHFPDTVAAYRAQTRRWL